MKEVGGVKSRKVIKENCELAVRGDLFVMHIDPPEELAQMESGWLDG